MQFKEKKEKKREKQTTYCKTDTSTEYVGDSLTFTQYAVLRTEYSVCVLSTVIIRTYTNDVDVGFFR